MSTKSELIGSRGRPLPSAPSTGTPVRDRLREHSRNELPALGPALDLMRRLWSVSHELEVLSGRMAKSIGITAQQRMIVRIVGRFPGITAGRLSELLCVDAATVSTALARLEKRNLVKRERDRRDRRRVTVSLTAAGRKLDVPAAGTVESAVEQVLSEVSSADTEALHRVLALLAVRFGAEGAE